MKSTAKLRSYLILTFSLATLVPLLILGFLALPLITSVAREQNKNQMNVLSTSLASEVNTFLGNARNTLRHEAALLENGLLPKAALEDSLQTLVSDYSVFSTILALDKKGFVKAISLDNHDFSGLDMSKQSYFRADAAQPFWSGTFMSFASSKASVAITVPFSGGSLVGIFDLSILSEIASKTRIDAKDGALIIDKNSVIIAARNYDLVSQREQFKVWNIQSIMSNSTLYYGRFKALGISSVMSVSSIPETGWFAVIQQPFSESERLVNLNIVIFILSLAFSALAVSIIAITSQKRISIPILDLSDLARHIEQNDYTAMPSQDTGLQETNELGAAFGSMIIAVNTREREMIAAKEELAGLLAEKTVLLQEVHHRVKNNLQVISSILNLEAQRTDSKNAEPLVNCQNRIQAIAEFHERLYLSANIARIKMDDYLSSICSHIFEYYATARGRIRMIVEPSETELGIDSAVPIGLITNEIITNSLKHAFPGETQGSITLSFAEQDEGLYLLCIRDDGIGINRGWHKEKESLGMTLIQALSGQLRGQLSIAGDSGTSIQLRFQRE